MLTSRVLFRAACLSTLAASLASAQGKGFTYDLLQKTQSNNPMMGPSETVAVRGKVQVDAAGHMRMDVSEAAKNPMWSAGDYALSDGASLVIVSPSRKEYLDLGADFGMAELAEMMKSTGMNMKMTEGKFTFDSMPGSEVINGKPTKHFHMSRDGTAEMTTPGGTMTMTTSSETDYYVAREGVPGGNLFNTQSAGSAGPGGMIAPETMEKMRSMAAAMKGFTVRMVTKSNTAVMGMTTDMTQSTEVENLTAATVAPISIKPPADYARVTLSSRMRSMMGGG
jgi:hypothetical protein